MEENVSDQDKNSDPIKVLDHGYVRFIESWGSDERIIEAARMSTDKGFVGWGPKRQCRYCGIESGVAGVDYNDCSASGGQCEMGPYGEPGDEKLLRYLWENNHATPFEMGGAVVEVQAPIFVFREWHRHRTQSYNELSARYTPLPNVNYIPTVERLMINAGTSNKQAGTVKGSEVLTAEHAEVFRHALRRSYEDADQLYQEALLNGVPKELARVHLPVGRYSRMRAQANLRNWLGFLTLRMAPNAQWEIRQYANVVHDVLAKKFPRTLALFDEAR